MPKEQPRMSEHSPCATSSKNAKDKSNSTTLLAMRDTKERRADGSSGSGSQCSSEKDSGFSDGSDWQHTDAEDQGSNKSQSRASEHAQAFQPGQNQHLGQRNPGNVPRMSGRYDHPPIYTIKDLVLNQQPGVIQKRDQLLWINGIPDRNFSGSPHVILYQQPSMVPDTLQLHKPLSRRSNVSGKKTNCSYLPILNSYPRIAPHPSKKPPDKSSLNHESQSLSKRVCTDPKIDDTPVMKGLPEPNLHKQPKIAMLASSLPSSSSTGDSLSSSSSTTASTNQRSTSVTSLHITSSSLTSRGHHRDSTSSTRHRRFLNTVEILRQSGLLDITLRTKELLRQSSATERGIAQLRQHTELLCEAATSHDDSPNGIPAWEHLHQVMAESRNYPDLKALLNLQMPPHPDSVSQPVSISEGDASKSEVAESSEVSPPFIPVNRPDQICAISPRSHSEQGRKLKAGDKSSDEVTFTLPDSSTG